MKVSQNVFLIGPPTTSTTAFNRGWICTIAFRKASTSIELFHTCRIRLLLHPDHPIFLDNLRRPSLDCIAKEEIKWVAVRRIWRPLIFAIKASSKRLLQIILSHVRCMGWSSILHEIIFFSLLQSWKWWEKFLLLDSDLFFVYFQPFDLSFYQFHYFQYFIQMNKAFLVP